MLHIHFGAGRLGLGLIVPFFRTVSTTSIIINRAISGTNPTGTTILPPHRRNQLLRNSHNKTYVVQQHTNQGARYEVAHYGGFFEYGEDGQDIASIIRTIQACYVQPNDRVVVTASLISSDNYQPVLEALEHLSNLREQGAIGSLFLVACENALNAPEIFLDPSLAPFISERMRRHVTPVPALVDRVCMGLEEGKERDQDASYATVVVTTEEYGSLKLELSPATEELARYLDGSRVEFTRYVAIEKRIKNWLLNGSHWLLALAAFEESHGDPELRLNEFLKHSAENRAFADEVMGEMHEGIAVILRREPEFSHFVHDIDPDDYLAGASTAILSRFLSNDDPMSRILARFQAPRPDKPTTVDAFKQRFADRVKAPIAAYTEKKGCPPPAATHSLRSLDHLIASGTYINAA